ncbi:unnamed protein product [Closterium sp. NIES-54]
MVQQVLQRFDFTYSSPQATPLSTRHSLSALPSDESVEPSGAYPELVGCLMYLMTCTRPDLAYPLSILARYVAPGRHRPEHMAAAKRVLRYLCSTSGMGLVLGGRRPVVLTGHADASWADDQATQRSSQGYTFSLGSGSISWRSTCSSSILGSSCEVEIYAGAMAAQELRWLTYLLTDLGEQPRSPPVLYVDNKASMEHRTKHIALRYFLAHELQQRGQLRLAYVASQANTADIFTKALPPGDHQRFCTMQGFPTCTQLIASSIIPVSSQGRTRMTTMKLTAGADVAEQQLGNEEASLILPHGYVPDEEDEPAYCFLAPAPEEPASMENALAGPDREKWLVSRDAEYQSLLENGTWDLVVLPEGKKAVQCKWVLRIKTDDKGQVTIYKSRLVAKGFMQKEKQDFNEIFAPIAKPPTLRVLLADAAVSGKSIIQMDISTAFLNGILEEDVYMTQPLGYEDGTGRVCKLKMSIYGLKQAPRCWYQKLAAVLEEMGFRTSSCDESLFLKGEGEKLVLFLVYVDDIILFSSMKEIQNVQQQLMKNFKCKTLGEVKYYLGMHVERDLDHRWLKLHQEKFIKELGEKYGIENERKVATPLPAEFKLVKAAEDEGVEAEEQQQFQSLVGSLLYAAVHTRPDISFCWCKGLINSGY